MSPTDFHSPELDQTQEELREGIENSRALVQQSRLLIELSQSDPASPGDEEYGLAN